jgi:hypothetical protein
MLYYVSIYMYVIDFIGTTKEKYLNRMPMIRILLITTICSVLLPYEGMYTWCVCSQEQQSMKEFRCYNIFDEHIWKSAVTIVHFYHGY